MLGPCHPDRRQQDEQEEHGTNGIDGIDSRRRRRLSLLGYGPLLAQALEAKRTSRRPPSRTPTCEESPATLRRRLRACALTLRAGRAFDAADALDLLVDSLLLQQDQEQEQEPSPMHATLTVLTALARLPDPLDMASLVVGRLGRALLARAREGDGAVLWAAYQWGKEVSSWRCVRGGQR